MLLLIEWSEFMIIVYKLQSKLFLMCMKLLTSIGEGTPKQELVDLVWLRMWLCMHAHTCVSVYMCMCLLLCWIVFKFVHANSSTFRWIFLFLWSNSAFLIGIQISLLLVLFAWGKNQLRYNCIGLHPLIAIVECAHGAHCRTRPQRMLVHAQSDCVDIVAVFVNFWCLTVWQ